MARVFVTNDPGDVDFSKAAQHGELVVMTRGKLNVYHPAEVLSKIAEHLATFEEEDYLLMCGGALSILSAGLLLPDLSRLKLLLYDSREKEYFVRSINYPAAFAALSEDTDGE